MSSRAVIATGVTRTESAALGCLLALAMVLARRTVVAARTSCASTDDLNAHGENDIEQLLRSQSSAWEYGAEYRKGSGHAKAWKAHLTSLVIPPLSGNRDMKNKGTLSSLGRAALKYARAGWHVFPVQPNGKEPIVANGFHAATNDVKQVRAWWREHPDANIGAAPGPSGYVVLDLDSRRAVRRARTLGAHRAQTRVCETGREGGGWHLYYQRPDFTIGNKRLAEQIDVRGDKGYVILPPSVHPSGSRYRWLDKKRAITGLPPKLLRELQSSQHTNGNGKHAPPLPDILREGDRNERLTSLAGTMRRRNASLDAILVALRQENAQRCRPPLEDNELQTIAASVSRYEPARTMRPSGKMQIAKLSSVEMEPVTWLWSGYLPLGKLVMLDGYPGQGKSAAMLDVAARGSRGRKMPDGSRGDVKETWETLILTYEDDAADTLRPRIEAAEGDPRRIRYVKGIAYEGEPDLLAPTLPQDLNALGRALDARPDTRLVIIDPLVASLSGKIDSHRDQDTRRVTAQLARIASERNVCIVGIRHFRKQTDGNSITAGGGSIGFIGQARVGLVIDQNPDEDSQSVLAVSKSNVGAKPASLAFTKESATVAGASGEAITTLKLTWCGTTPHTADGMLQSRAQNAEGDQHDKNEVDRWLRRLLRDEDGHVDRAAVLKAARASGYPERTIANAAKRVGVRSKSKGFGVNKRAVWSLPDAEDTNTPSAPENGRNGKNGRNHRKSL